jgi:hypothetical protein
MSSTTDAGKASNHYQLLRLKQFETDQVVIRSNFHKLMDQLRAKIAAEPTAVKWRVMQADMTRAMLVLCDARRKADYDLSLGNTTARDVRPPELAKILKARKLLDDVELDRAIKFADTVNIELRDAVVQQKLLSPEIVMPLYADSLGLPFVHLADLTIDDELIPTVPAIMARQHSLTPVLREGKTVIIASPNPLRPEIEDQLRLRYGSAVTQVICTKSAVDEVIEKYYSKETVAAQMSTAAAPRRKSSGSSSDSSSKAPALEAAPRMNRAELRKKKLKIGFVCGAFTMMVIVFADTLFLGYGTESPMMVPMIGMGVGLVAFAIGFLVVND